MVIGEVEVEGGGDVVSRIVDSRINSASLGKGVCSGLAKMALLTTIFSDFVVCTGLKESSEDAAAGDGLKVSS